MSQIRESRMKKIKGIFVNLRKFFVKLVHFCKKKIKLLKGIFFKNDLAPDPFPKEDEKFFRKF